MYSRITTGAVRGISSYLIRVETDISDGLPSFNMVGFLGTEVREAGERVRVAMRNFGVRMPPRRITVNLAPADIPKRGIVLDLPVCVGVLICMGILPADSADGCLIAGELGLSGDILPVKGIMAIVRGAKEEGIHTCIIPSANRGEGAVIEGVKVIGVSSLKELVGYLSVTPARRDSVIAPARTDAASLLSMDSSGKTPDFSSVHGHAEAKRVLEIAAAGRHNVLLTGPPGTGKSMLASCLPGIMPRLTVEECLEITSIYSAAGKLPPDKQLITERPFLSVHQTTTRAALTGGGKNPVPGLFTLAHLGILFLDEMAEMNRDLLNTLLIPLEEHRIRIARQGGPYVFPCRFLFVGAVNPCPCGFFPDRGKCHCTPWEIARYQKRISGPLMDRIDLQAVVGRIRAEEMQGRREEFEESSSEIRKRVEEAVCRQRERFKGTGIIANGDMDAGMTEEYCVLGNTQRAYMKTLYDRFSLSGRGYHRILRTARTIADLDDSDEIRTEHLEEAAHSRMKGAGKED